MKKPLTLVILLCIFTQAQAVYCRACVPARPPLTQAQLDAQKTAQAAYQAALAAKAAAIAAQPPTPPSKTPTPCFNAYC